MRAMKNRLSFLRLRVGNHRVFFKETADTITIHRVRNRREAYR